MSLGSNAQRFSTGATISLNLADVAHPAARTRILAFQRTPTRYSGNASPVMCLYPETVNSDVWHCANDALRTRRHVTQSRACSPALYNLANEINPNPAPRRFRLNQFRGNSRRVPEIKSAYTAAGACRHARLNAVQCHVFLHVQTTLPPAAALRASRLLHDTISMRLFLGDFTSRDWNRFGRM